jgi:hypothetical protein
MGYSLMVPFDDERTDPKHPGICRECNHLDCATSRALRAKPCAICGKPIAAYAKFYTDDNRQPVHAVCAWDREEARQKENRAKKGARP